MSNVSITVLMSTYNGEQFIEEQIETILAQNGVDVKLLIRDDGSSDATVCILEKYKRKGLLEYFVGDNCGWKRSFMKLAINAPASDYYAFSDQDDHWLPDKLKVATSALKKLPEGPNLYVSNTYYWRGDFVEITNSLKPDVTKDRCLVWNLGPGCTMVFNRQLMNVVKEYPMLNPEIPHDQWFMCSAYVLGHVYYDMNSYIWYRQHNNNQLGATISKKEILQLRYKTFKELKKHRDIEILAKQLLLCYGEILCKEKKESCIALANYRNSIRQYLYLLFTNNFNNESFVTTLGMKLRILLRHL